MPEDDKAMDRHREPRDTAIDLSDIRAAVRAPVTALITASPDDALRIAHLIAAERGWSDELVVCDFASREHRPRVPLAIASPRPPQAVLLREVHALTPSEQDQLMDLIDARLDQPEDTPCIIASSSVSLFNCVTCGTFDERLFYRLNTVHLVASTGTRADGLCQMARA